MIERTNFMKQAQKLSSKDFNVWIFDCILIKSMNNIPASDSYSICKWHCYRSNQIANSLQLFSYGNTFKIKYMLFYLIFILSIDIICKIFAKLYTVTVWKSVTGKRLYEFSMQQIQNPTYASWYDWLIQQKDTQSRNT